MGFWKKFGKVAAVIGKSTIAVVAPQWVSASVERIEGIIVGPGKGSEKAAEVLKDIDERILPEVERMIGKNVSTPEVRAAAIKFRDVYVAFKNAESELDAAREALEDAIEAVKRQADAA